MRKTPNQLAFEHLPTAIFWKTLEAVAANVRDFEPLFPDAIGYDAACDGYIAVNSGHSRAALASEMPVCVFLKKAGFGVTLLEESGFHKSPDVKVGGIFFEIKTIKNAKNLKNALIHQFRAAKKQSENLLIHIVQPATSEQLRSNFFYSVKQVKSVRLVWILWRGQLYQFSRADILADRHRFR